MLTCNTELCHKCCLYFRECSTSQCIINTLRALWWKKQSWQRVYKQQSSASKNTSASNHSWPQVWAEVSLVSLFWVPLFKTQLYNLPQKQWNVVFHHQTRCMNALNTTVMKKLAHAALWNDLEASTTLLITCFSLLVKQLIAHTFV